MKWNEENIKFLKENYGKMTNKEIAEKLKTTKASVDCKISKLGLNKNKNKGNINLFERIDSEESAYWLGFIYADGYILTNKSDKGTNYELGIELCIDDISHLNKFNSIFGNYYKISTRKRKMDYVDKLNDRPITNRYAETCLLRIYSKKIVNDLINNGIVQNKTNSNIFPIINDNDMFLHFLRGYIDGDGTYFIDKKNRIRISIQGNNIECFKFIKEKLERDFNIHSCIIKDRNCWKFYIGRKKEVLKLMDLMFNNTNIYLDRKYEKMIEIKNAVYIGNNINY